MDDRGSVGILFLSILVFVGAGLAGVSIYVGAAARYGGVSERAYAVRLSLDAAAREIAARLSEDFTPESDSPRDSIWTALGERDDGIVLSLDDFSSGLNPNYSSVGLLDSADLRSMFAPGRSPEELAKYRAEKGLSSETSHYAGIFADDALRSLSCFGWANVNTADRDSLRALCLSLTGSEGRADAFSAKIEAARSAKRIIGPESLKSFLGSEHAWLFPLICAEAPHNAHFASPRLIRAILSLPALGLADPSARADALIAARDDHDLTEAELASLCGAASGRQALQYLGLRTWFWRIRAEGSGHAYSMVLAASPGSEGDRPETRRYAVVETRFDS
jgi:hypothetical protein